MAVSSGPSPRMRDRQLRVLIRASHEGNRRARDVLTIVDDIKGNADHTGLDCACGFISRAPTFTLILNERTGVDSGIDAHDFRKAECTSTWIW